MGSFAEYHNKRNKTKINLDNNIIDINIEDEKEEESPFMKYHNEREKQEYEKKLRKKEYDDEEDTDTWFKKGAFDDGYQFGDLTKTVGSTVGDATVGLGKGIFRLGEGVGDLISYGVADIQEWTGNEEAAEATRERTRQSVTDEIFQPAEDFVDKNSVLGDKSDSITEGLGYVAGITAISIVSGGAGSALGVSSTAAATVGSTAATFTSAMGSGMSEALNDGATIEEARIYGAISGAGEAASELLFGGLGKASGALGLSKGVGELDDIIIGGMTKNIKNKMVKTVMQSGLKATGEGLEEIVSGLISSAGKKLTYMDEKEYSEIVKDENLAEQFWMGALTSAIAQGPSTIKSVKSGTDYITGRTSNEQQIFDSLKENKTTEVKTQKAIDNMINEQQIRLKELYGRELTTEEVDKIKNTVSELNESGKLDIENTSLNKKEQARIEKEIENDLAEGNLSLETIRDILGENVDLSKDNLLQKSLYEDSQRYEDYKVELTGNEKVDKFLQSAAEAGVNNTTKTRKRIELISKLVENTDRNYRFVNQEQLKEMGYNENANGLNDNGEILLSVNSNKEIVAVVGHETTHLFDSKVDGEYTQEYKDLQNAVKDYLKAKGTYESKVNQIMETYSKAGINLSQEQIMEEVTADTIGDNLFGDNAEEFIKHLTTNRTVFQKIYDYIKKAVVNIKGYKSEEAKQLQNLKNAFDRVYKTLGTEYKTIENEGQVQYNVSESERDINGRYENASIGRINEKTLRGNGYSENTSTTTNEGTIRENANMVKEQQESIVEENGRPIQDNRGTKLNKKQQEFYDKDKAVDSEGRLIRFYHSTEATFNIYDKKRIGQNYGGWLEFGDGFYFAPSSELADAWSETRSGKNNTIIKEQYLNVKNPFYIYGNNKNDVNIINKMVEEIESIYNKKNNSNYKMSEYKKQNGGRIISAMKDSLNFTDTEVRDILQKYGYDGIDALTEKNGEIKGQYVVFEPNQIKNVDNTSPTSDPDIRYSISEDTENGVEALENYKNNKKQEYERIANEFGGGPYFWEANLDGIDKDSAIRMLKRDSRVQQKFIENNKFEKVYKPVEYSRFKTQEMQNFIKDNNITSLKDLVNNQKLTNEYFDLWFGKKESLNDYTKQSYEAWKDLFDSQVEVYSRGGETLRALKSFERDIKNINSGVTEIIDEYETAKKLENMPEFNKYVEKFVDPLYGEKPKLSTEELTELAQDTFGTTTNFDVGAYMTPDGKLLNFGDHGYRNDHRDISSIGYDMQEFIDAGNIRMKPEGNGFELKLEPTSKQYETLSNYIDILKGEVYVEIDIGNNKYDGANYKEGTSTSKIISDLQYYFKNGKFPTKSEFADFRYSLTQGETDQYWKKQIKNSEESSFNLDNEVGNYLGNNDVKESKTVEEVLNETPEEKQQSMKDKAKKYISRSRTNFINNIVDNFGTSKLANTNTLNTVTEQIREDVQQNGKLTIEQKNKYFNDLYNNLVKIDTQYYDTYKEVKDNIRNTKLYINDNIRGDIADFGDFRRSNMGTIIMTNDSSNISVDQYYQEMSDMYPELFPKNITNPTDQLQKISEVAKDIKKVETNVAAYNDATLGKDYRNWARETFDKDIDKFVYDIRMAERYNNESNTTEKIGMTKELVKQAYNQLPAARRKYEKASAKEVLTKEDRVQVDRLLNNEITIQEIPDGLNKEGIVRLATAKAEYDAIQKSIKEYQLEIKQNRIEQAKADIGNLDLWKDKKIGFQYSRETTIRNIYDVAPKGVADTILNKYFRPYIETNEKKVINETNEYFDRVRDLDLSDKKKYKVTIDGETKKVSESALVQLLGENKITLEQIKNTKADSVKIESAVNEFRNIYNEMFEKINESMLDNGYAPVEYRKDYFPHFTEQTTDTLLGKAAKLLGFDLNNREELPTDISGQTYQFKPGRTWFSNLLQRTTDVTDYDAKKGFEKYVKGAMDLIYHTGDIQNLRALSNAIRGTYNDTEIKNQVQEINESTTLTDLEKAQEIQRIYDTAKDKSHLSKFTEWLDNYINLLAGKKAINDRGAEKELNRTMYQTMTNIESRIAANAIGGNVGVSLTNFAPISQAWGEVKTHNLINGMWQTMKSSIKGDDSFVSESQFITRRRGIDNLTQTKLEKATAPINALLEFADRFTSETIVRARYNQNIHQGMNTEQALEEADRYTAGLMADRGRGALPTQFSNKNPIAKMINMFQVEVNNQWSYYIKDLPRNIQEKANNNKAKLVTDTAMAYTKIMVGSYLINELLGSIRGNSTRVLPDPIYIVKELIKGLSDGDDDNDDDAIIDAMTEVAGNLPFISLPATLLTDSLGLDVGDIGRIPISGSIPNIADITKDLLDSDMTAGEKVKSIGGELADTVGASLILPYGGSQIKKTVKGLSMYTNNIPGSYTDKGDLRYTVDEDVGSKVQAALFGAYANPYAQDYIDSGFKTIKKDNIDEMVGLDMNSTEYREFRGNLNKVSDTSDKNGYKQYTDENNNVYWYDANSETMYDSKYKKTTLTEDDLIKVSKKEQALNYINSLDLTTAQKNLAANNLNKNSKKKIDMSEYGNYDSYEEYQYARDYPKKYSVVSQIAEYDDYVRYKDAIAEIKKEYSTELGYESKERKAAVQSYIEGLDLNMYQKMMLEKMAGGYSIKKYQNYIYEYLETTGLSESEKYTIWEELFE